MTNFDQRNQHVFSQFNTETINIYRDILPCPEDTDTLTMAQLKLSELPLDIIPEVAPLPPDSHIRYRPNPHFVGRKGSLRALAAAVKGNNSVVIGQLETVAATGMGGIGKTQLVSEFVHRYGQYFAGGVFWLSFANAKTVPNEIADCINMVGLEKYLNLDNFSLDDKVRLVRLAWQSPIPRLLIFDGCEDEQLFDQWRPLTGGCRVLITSLSPHWSSELGIKVLPLDCLERGESRVLLSKYREDLAVDDPDLDAIADELGDLPLALHLAGSYLKRYRYSGLGIPAAYLVRLRQETMPYRKLCNDGQ